MFKQKVSQEELNKKPETTGRERLDLNYFKKYLQGSTLDDLSREYNISRGQVQIRINDAMQKLPEVLKQSVPDRKLITDCLLYKGYWSSMISNYELGIQLHNENMIFANFIMYYKKQSAERKAAIIHQLKEYDQS